MLDIKIIRENPDEAHRRLKRRGTGAEAEIDKLLELDDERRKLLSQSDNLKNLRKKKTRQRKAKRKVGRPKGKKKDRRAKAARRAARRRNIAA